MGFRLGSIPVRVRITFLILTVFLGSSERVPARVAAWVAIVFVSVLVHELGHALVGKAFGLAPQIELHGMGGTTSWIGGKNVGRGKSIAISLAGPMAGFAFATILVLATGTTFGHLLGVLGGGRPPAPDLRRFALDAALWVNVGWGIFNLVPVMPLDGGNVMRNVFEAIGGDKGERAARILSIAIAGTIAALAAMGANWWLLAIAAIFVMSNVQAIQQRKQIEADTKLATAIEQANLALAEHDGERAAALLAPQISPVVSIELRQVAVRLLAYAMLLEGKWPEVLAVLEREKALVPREELERFARTARELQRPDEAARIDELAAQAAPTPPNPLVLGEKPPPKEERKN
jgi:Zn-dependent protease